ncbi:hypothetical protein RCL_jg8968.t1 [Rhizophagus clarus]|uniref:Uncharacterized protein n=1 Tax=Rhizophagus clarus TaxID=94130 RepID=A0A8H3QCC3_9GLOM|nr:hypothetical protein RCL_jg8968.t1 [Rhizophagus clarus]
MSGRLIELRLLTYHLLKLKYRESTFFCCHALNRAFISRNIILPYFFIFKFSENEQQFIFSSRVTREDGL